MLAYLNIKPLKGNVLMTLEVSSVYGLDKTYMIG